MVNLNSLFETLDPSTRKLVITQLDSIVRNLLTNKPLLNDNFTIKELLDYHFQKIESVSNFFLFINGLRQLNEELLKVEDYG